MLYASLQHARKDAAWGRGDLVATRLGTVHALVRGCGPDVILLHGVTDNAHTWSAIQDELGGGARTHALDLPGHGLSDFPKAPLTPREMAGWVVAYMDAARIERAVVVGWSLGGAVAVALAAHHGARTSAIVLESPAVLHFPLPEGLRILCRVGIGEVMPLAGLADATRRAALAANYGRGFRPSDDVLRRYFLGWNVRSRAGYIRAVLRAERWREVDDYAHEVQTPAFVVHGERDRFVPVRIGHEIGRRLARAEVRTLPKIGHVPHLEEPGAVLTAIASALRA